jgi:hypothetical protein
MPAVTAAALPGNVSGAELEHEGPHRGPSARSAAGHGLRIRSRPRWPQGRPRPVLTALIIPLAPGNEFHWGSAPVPCGRGAGTRINRRPTEPPTLSRRLSPEEDNPAHQHR